MSTQSTAKLDTLICHYAVSHKNPRNELLHCVCVPAIMFSIVGILFAINFGITLIAIAVAILYYNHLGQKAAMQMGAVLILMLFVWMLAMPAHHIITISVAIFILAWVGQLVGHFYEGAKPSFTEDLQYLAIGPLYVLNVLRNKAFPG